jgi:hypothetical protein
VDAQLPLTPGAVPNASTVPGSFDFTSLSRGTSSDSAHDGISLRAKPSGVRRLAAINLTGDYLWMPSICNKMPELLKICVAAAVRKVLEQSGYFEPFTIEPAMPP